MFIMNQLKTLFLKRASYIQRQFLFAQKVKLKNQSFTGTTDCCLKNFNFYIKWNEQEISDIINKNKK